MANGFKTGGREIGTPNTITKDIRERIEKIIDIHFNEKTFEKDLKQLDPEKRLTIMIKLLEFTLPKLQATKLESDSYTQVSINPKRWVGELENDLANKTIE